MKQHKREICLYSLYDFTGIAHHLETRARQGWQLEKIGGTFWHYRRCEPSDMRYAVVYFAKASDLDAGPSQEQQDFWSMCQATGWQLAANRAQLQIFRNPDPDAIPIETDPVVQVENIHASMKKTLLIPHLVLMVCALLQVMLQGSRMGDLRDFLTNPFSLANILIWSALGIHCGWELLDYLLWHRKARAAAREEGILLSPKSRRWRPLVLLAVCGIYLLLMLSMLLGVSGQGSSAWSFLLFGVVYATALVGSVRGCQWLMKKKGISPTTNRVLSCVIGIVVGIVLITGMAKLTLNSGSYQRFQGHANAETITYTWGNHTYTYDFYRDDLPLTIEDLLGAEPDPEYSRYLDISGTPLLTEYTARQRTPYYSNTDKPQLSYTVWEVGVQSLENAVRESFFTELAERNEKYGLPGEAPDTWEITDTAPWGALEAWQYYNGGQSHYTYLLRYERRFINITFSDWKETPPTAEQMALVGEALGSGELT